MSFSAKQVTHIAQVQQCIRLIILHCNMLQLSLAVNSAIREAVMWNELTDSQLSLFLSVMDINEERGRQKMELSRGGGDLQMA